MVVDAWLKREHWRHYIGLPMFVRRRFMADGALDMASSLSYTSLLSLVPLMAIALAMLAAFPVFDSVRQQLEDAAFRYFVPQVGEQVQGYVSSFVGNAGRLTAAGIVGLAFTAIMLLVTIETSLNRIFRVATARSSVSRLLVYWTALTLGPLLVGASFSMSAWVYAAGDLASRVGLSWLVVWFGQVIPNLLLVFSFSLLYLAVPNRRVAPAHALAGGLAATVVFALLRWGFSIYVARSHSYQSVYGAVALVPIFLFWMYLSWAVVLFGAEICAALPEWHLARGDTHRPLPARRRLGLALSILAALWSVSRRGGAGKTDRELMQIVAEPEATFLAVLSRLIEEGHVVATAKGRYVLGRDLSTLTLGDIVRVLDLGLLDKDEGTAVDPRMEKIAASLSDAASAQSKHLDVPLSALLDQAGDIGAEQPHRSGILRAAGGS